MRNNKETLASIFLAGLLFCPGASMAQSIDVAVPPVTQPDTSDPTSKPTAKGQVVTDAPTLLPEGALDPVTLKARLEKTEKLPLTLENALSLAEGQNITIQTQEELSTLRRQEYQYRLSELLPDVALTYNQSRFTGGVQIFGAQTLNIYRTSYQPQITVNYSIYSAGKNIFEIKASKQRRDAQESLKEEARQDILAQVAIAYYDLQRAYWGRAIALRSIEEAEQQLKLTQGRYDAGVGIRQDVLEAQTNLSRRQQDLLLAENQIVKVSQRMARLLNMDFEVDILPPALESTVRPLISKDVSTSQMLGMAKSNFPRLKALAKLRDASKTDVTVAITDLFPRFDITAYTGGTGAEFTNLEPTRFAGVQVSTNLLENMGLGKPSLIGQARTNARIAQLNLADAERVLEEKLGNDLADMETLEKAIAVNRKALASATQSYNLAFGRLQEGLGTYIDLVTVQTSLARVRSDLATSFLEYNKAQVAVLYDLGLVTVTSLTQGYFPNGSSPVLP